MAKVRRISSFSVLLIMTALMIIGLSMIPLLSIQYTPIEKTNSISISYHWPNASARLVEQEVTSKIEGAIARMSDISQLSSISSKGKGSVTVNFKKNVKMDAARFETASILRDIYPRLPDGVGYPSISLSSAGLKENPVLSYTINSGIPPVKIKEYLDQKVIPLLSRVGGVSRIDLSGVNAFEYEISFDPLKAQLSGVSSGDMLNSLYAHFENDHIGFNFDQNDNVILVKLRNSTDFDISGIPVKKTGGRILYLSDLAEVRYKETLPQNYFRVNGLNTINVTIYGERGVNLLTFASDLKKVMSQIEESFPEGMSAMINYDSSEYIRAELWKVGVRTFLTFTILLLFVLLVSRRWNYLWVIATTLIANILVAVVFYNLLNIDIHLYSLAGFTVSLGIIIDTSIIMVDHYAYYKDRRAFASILGAILTTVASLSVIFFLPENQKIILYDFALIIIVNLIISLAVSLMFIPALMDKFPVGRGIVKSSRKQKRRIIRMNKWYGNYIRFIHNRKLIWILLLILTFGIPLHLLPEKIETDQGKEANPMVSLYNKTIGGDLYQSKKESLEKIFGGTLRLFMNKISGRGFYREPGRRQFL